MDRMDRSEPIHPEFTYTSAATIGSQGVELPDLTIGSKEGTNSSSAHGQYDALEEPAIVNPKRTRTSSPSPETTAEIGRAAGHSAVDLPEPAVALPNRTAEAAAPNASEGQSDKSTPEETHDSYPERPEPSDNPRSPLHPHTFTSDSQSLLPRSDAPRLTLGGDAERAPNRTPDEIAIHEEKRALVIATAKDIALPYERALRDIVPDEPRKGWFGITRGGNVERQFEITANGRTVSYQVSAGYTPYGETNDLTRADIKISKPDIPKKESPTLSVEFGRTGLDTATLDVPYSNTRDSLKFISSLPAGQILAPYIETFTKYRPSTEGFTLRLSLKGDQLTYQLRQLYNVTVPYGEITSLRLSYEHTSLIYNPATDTFDTYSDGWEKYPFQALNNSLIDGRTRTDSNNPGLHITREAFFTQLRAMLGLLPTQEQPNI